MGKGAVGQLRNGPWGQGQARGCPVWGRGAPGWPRARAHVAHTTVATGQVRPGWPRAPATVATVVASDAAGTVVAAGRGSGRWISGDPRSYRRIFSPKNKQKTLFIKIFFSVFTRWGGQGGVPAPPQGGPKPHQEEEEEGWEHPKPHTHTPQTPWGAAPTGGGQGAGGGSQLSNHLLLLGTGASLPRIFLLYRSTSSLKRASAAPLPPRCCCAWGAEQGGGDGGPRPSPRTPQQEPVSRSNLGGAGGTPQPPSEGALTQHQLAGRRGASGGSSPGWGEPCASPSSAGL